MVQMFYTGEPPVLNFDKMAAYLFHIFLKLITLLKSVLMILEKLKIGFGNFFNCYFFDKLLTTLLSKNREHL